MTHGTDSIRVRFCITEVGLPGSKTLSMHRGINCSVGASLHCQILMLHLLCLNHDIYLCLQ